MSTLRALFLISVAFSIIQCSPTPKGTQIAGTISDAGDLKVFFDRMTSGGMSGLVNGNLDAQGNFNFQFEDGLEEGLYRLRIGNKREMLILDGNESDIEIKGSLEDFGRGNLSITGSELSTRMNDYLKRWFNRELPAEQLHEAVANEEHPLIAMQLAASTVGNIPEFYKIHKIALNKLNGDKKYDMVAREYGKKVGQLESMYLQKLASERIKVGMEAPEISMPNPNGNPMPLSDLEGKVVLVDFWASWCRPCRRANPHVVEMYHKYKDRGFTVYSISLDGLADGQRARYPDESSLQEALAAQKERWTRAIEKDKLSWNTHVSDLAKWDTQAAKEYGVTGIPKTFLIDRQGKIASINPRYNLEEELLKVL